MVAANVSQYFNEKDKYSEKVSSWAEQTAPGHFRCKVCMPFKVLSFKKGRFELFKHSESTKHRKNLTDSEVLTQPTIGDLFSSKKNEDEISEKALNLEIALSMVISRHGIPFQFFDCITEILKSNITNSEIVDKMSLGRDSKEF